jgi:hypothetical protein
MHWILIIEDPVCGSRRFLFVTEVAQGKPCGGHRDERKKIESLSHHQAPPYGCE